ncbi:MAG: NAD(P)-dependent oxidoreductase [Planctomycetota bacterium]
MITGALGLVGSRVWPQLAERYDLVGLDKQAPSDAGHASIDAVDLADYEQVYRAMRDAKAVVHLAIASERALKHLDDHAYTAEEIRVNVLGTRNVFEAAAVAGVKRVVYMSSLTVYFNNPMPERVEINTPLQPRNHYAITKLYGEQLAWWYAANEKLTSVCWRLGQPFPVDHFGPAQLAEPASRACAVATDDIAWGIIAGLESRLPADGRGGLHTGFKDMPGHAVANLVSASDAGPDHGFELTAAEALGFVPRVCFTADGPVPHSTDAGQ